MTTSSPTPRCVSSVATTPARTTVPTNDSGPVALSDHRPHETGSFLAGARLDYSTRSAMSVPAGSDPANTGHAAARAVTA